jgi:hypothetical protein
MKLYLNLFLSECRNEMFHIILIYGEILWVQNQCTILISSQNNKKTQVIVT